MNKIRVAHISSVHLALDTRIFYRYCLSLKQDYDVTLIACHDKKEVRNGISIIPFYRYKNRIFRVLFGWLIMFPMAWRAKAKIYHLHDPELIPLGLLLHFLGKKVIYDIHENIAEDIFDKEWIRFKSFWHKAYDFFEKPALKRLTIILAEDSYKSRYDRLDAKYTVVHNYCDLAFFEKQFSPMTARNPLHLFYIGILLLNRGILEILEAIYIAKNRGYVFHFHCVAELYTQVTEAVIKLPFYEEIKNQVTFYGRMPLEQGYELSKTCGIGLCIIHPMSNSIESYPTKLFEYMAVGLPAISSNFPLYKSVLEAHNCGITVDPLNPELLATKMIALSEDKIQLTEMAIQGKKAVFKHYNWQNEVHLIREIYKNLLN